jgi:hypothetical protein
VGQEGVREAEFCLFAAAEKWIKEKREKSRGNTRLADKLVAWRGKFFRGIENQIQSFSCCLKIRSIISTISN